MANRFFTLQAIGILIVLVLATPGYAKDITIYTWDDYISEEVVESFQEKTGIMVHQVYFDSDKTRDEIVASTRGRQFDIVVFDSIAAQIFGKNNYLTAVNESEVPNISNIDTQWQESCGNFGIPYFYGTIGLVYDSAHYPKAPGSWHDLLEPAQEHRGHVVMLEDLIDTLIPPLLYLGYSINSESREELKAAYRLLQQQAPSVLNYQYALSNIKASNSGLDMHLALAYSGDQYVLNETTGTENWKYVIPREGTAIWVDCMSVTAWSENYAEANEFLNYINDPKIAAQNTESIYNASPISGVKEFMSDEAATDPELFLPEEVLRNGQKYRILSDNNLRQRGRILTTLLKRHETP